MAKVLAKKIDSDDVLPLLYPLLDGLLDNEASSASGACVVMNGLFRLRGDELEDEVPEFLDALQEKMVVIEHDRTS